MANYKIIGDAVIELPTEQVIAFFDDKKEAINVCNFLNSGGGFDGFTPAFFLIPIDVEW